MNYTRSANNKVKFIDKKMVIIQRRKMFRNLYEEQKYLAQQRIDELNSS